MYSLAHPEFDMKRCIESWIPELCKSPRGIYAVASLLFIESRRQQNPRSAALGLDTHHIAQVLKKAVYNHQEDLKEYRLEAGYDMPEGLLTDLRRLSGILAEGGGPSFVDV
jgi:hypothetical protein